MSSRTSATISAASRSLFDSIAQAQAQAQAQDARRGARVGTETRILPADEVEARLRDALGRLDAARRDAVTWFAEILSRKLYLAFDCSSIHQYARERLGFSRARTAYFLRLVRAFEELPGLHRAVASGEVPWTKAREIVKVATPATEDHWIAESRRMGRRELERQVATVRERAARRRRAPGQGELSVASGGASAPGASEKRGAADIAESAPVEVIEVPIDVSIRFSPEQAARYEALVERARRAGFRGSRENMLLAALEALGDAGARDSVGESRSPTPGDPASGSEPSAPGSDSRSAPRTQVVLHQCVSCGSATLPTTRGDLPVSATTLRTLLCDARVQRLDGSNRATIPPKVRRTVLARDGHRCRAPGCRSSRFLDVHHVVPRSAGGSNDPGNLVTLCAACHRLVHATPGPEPRRFKAPAGTRSPG